MANLKYTYIASDNTATNGTAIGVDNQDVVIKAIVFGLPADTKYATVYNIVNPVTGASTNIAAKITQPTAAAGKDWVRVATFGEEGLRLGEGGNVVTDASQVTVIWEEA